jgi:hypothetical protein
MLLEQRTATNRVSCPVLNGAVSVSIPALALSQQLTGIVHISKVDLSTSADVLALEVMWVRA